MGVATIGETSGQLALRDPDIRLMLARPRRRSPARSRSWSSTTSTGWSACMHHLVGNADEAEDLAQEVFLRVYRARKKYRPRAKFSTWLFTIANNLALNALRTRQRKPVVPLHVQRLRPAGARGRPSNWCAIARRAAVRRLCSSKSWPPSSAGRWRPSTSGRRMAVVLNKFEDMNYAEIAEVMGLTTKAVKSLLSRARPTCGRAGGLHLHGRRTRASHARGLGSRRRTFPMADTHSPDDRDREQFSAYLDGEVDPTTARAIEAKISLDPQARLELDSPAPDVGFARLFAASGTVFGFHASDTGARDRPAAAACRQLAIASPGHRLGGRGASRRLRRF